MSDVAGFGGYAHSALRDLAPVGLVWDGVACGVNLNQGIIHGVIHLQFEHKNVVLGLYDYIGTSLYALHLGIHLAVKQREYHIHQELIEILASLLRHPFLAGDDIVGNTGDIGTEFGEGCRQVAFEQ